ncbi:MAG: hypothetical protein IJF92_00810 [Bacilli bacterium]|nr:hypothetical protein [Bacilli bacterium]MBQ3307646.1 hypothetical protein [Bacilli bacterium]
MQGFIKDKKELIINSQILDNEKEDLVEFTEKAAEKGVNVVKLYDTEGNVAGVKFEVR